MICDCFFSSPSTQSFSHAVTVYICQNLQGVVGCVFNKTEIWLRRALCLWGGRQLQSEEYLSEFLWQWKPPLILPSVSALCSNTDAHCSPLFYCRFISLRRGAKSFREVRDESLCAMSRSPRRQKKVVKFCKISLSLKAWFIQAWNTWSSLKA